MGKVHVDRKTVECPERFVPVERLAQMAAIPQTRALARVEPDGRLVALQEHDEIDTEQAPQLTTTPQFEGW